MELYQLINIVAKKGKRNAFVLSNGDGKNDDQNVQDLYTNVKTGVFLSENEASQKIFGDSPSNKNYIRLRSKLKDALFSNLFFLNYDNDRHPEHVKVEYEVRKNILQCKILLREGDKENAVWLLNKTYKMAEQYHFTDEMVEIKTMQRNQIAYSGNLSKFTTINDELTALKNIQDIEHEAQFLMYASMCNILKSLVNKRRFAKEFKTWISQIENLKKKCNTPFINLAEFRMKSAFYMLTEDYNNLLKVCEVTEELMHESESHMLQTKYTEIALCKLNAYLNLKQYDLGAKYAKKSLKHFQKDNNNWFTFMEYAFLLSMRTGNYDNAANIMDDVKTNIFFRSQNERAKDRWYIYQGYFSFVRPDHKPKFQIMNFLGRVPEYSRENMGFDISTLIIHYFHLLQMNDSEGMQLRIDLMKKYIMKQIARSGNERVQCFLRLLQVAHQNGFNYELVMEKTDNYRKKLKRYNSKAEIFEELEVLEYDYLWSLLEQMMKERTKAYSVLPS